MDEYTKTLFNSLRMSYLKDPTIPFDTWKTEDLGAVKTAILFERLCSRGVYLTRTSFLSYAASFESPETFMQWLAVDLDIDRDHADDMYLIIFELWKRLLPEKISISIFADTFDWAIFSFENSDVPSQSCLECLETQIERLYQVLVENVDLGMSPKEVFSAVSEYFSNNLESFLFRFINFHLKNDYVSYARQLLHQFSSFIIEPVWFSLLQANLVAREDSGAANKLLTHIFEENKQLQSVELDLHLIESAAFSQEHDLFINSFRHALELIEDEEDFLALLTVASNYCGCIDQTHVENKINDLIKKREKRPQRHMSFDDPDCDAALKCVEDLRDEVGNLYSRTRPDGT